MSVFQLGQWHAQARQHHNVSIGAHQGASLASREKRAESAVFSRHGCINLPEPDLTPIEWLWGDGPWPPLSSCYWLFAGVYRGRLERGVIAAVQSSCGVVIYTVNSLASNIDTMSTHVWTSLAPGHHLTQGPLRVWTSRRLWCSSATAQVAALRTHRTGFARIHRWLNYDHTYHMHYQHWPSLSRVPLGLTGEYWDHCSVGLCAHEGVLVYGLVVVYLILHRYMQVMFLTILGCV